jgi:hypothetical protein
VHRLRRDQAADRIHSGNWSLVQPPLQAIPSSAPVGAGAPRAALLGAAVTGPQTAAAAEGAKADDAQADDQDLHAVHRYEAANGIPIHQRHQSGLLQEVP